MRILALALSALASGCALVSGLNDLQVCTTSCDGGGQDAASDVSVGPDDAGDAAWTPTSVTGLALWLNSAIGVTTTQGLVSRWVDQSGNHNDAVQAILARQPTLVPTSIRTFPALRFLANAATGPGGTQLTIADSVSLQWGTRDYYVAVVARFDNQPTDGNAAGIGILYAKTGATSSAALALTGNFVANNAIATGLGAGADTASTSYPGAFNDGVARLYACERAGTALMARVGGVASFATALPPTVDVSGVGGSVLIGAMADAATSRLDGDIAEIIAMVAPSSADVSNVENYLSTKYGL